jgi:hypothetical protein
MSKIKVLFAEEEGIDDLIPTRPSNNNIADIVLEWAKTPETEDYIADHAYFALGDDDGQPCMFLENFTTLCDEIALDTLDRLIEQEHYDLSDMDYAQIVERASNLIADFYADYKDVLCADELADYNRDKKYLATDERERHGQC